MKRMIAALVLTSALVSPVKAADIFGDGSLKDGGGSSRPAMNWGGIYVGAAIGYGHANHELSLQEYFKDYCANSTDTALGFDDSSSDREKTVAERNVGSGKTAGQVGFLNSCEEVVTAPTAPATTNGVGPTTLKTVSGDSREQLNLNGLDSSGLVGDIRLGADLQRGRIVFGVFGTYGFNDMTTTVSAAGVNINLIEKGDEWSVGGRLGYLVNDRTLAYVLGAYTQSDFAFGLIGGNGSAKEVSFSGVTVGGGVEFALTQNVFFGIEGTHTFYGEESLIDVYDAGDNEGSRLTDTIGETKVMGTLKVKLNSGLPSVLD